MKTLFPILALLFFFVLPAFAEQFGLFTYRVWDGGITITDYPWDATGPVEIPAEIAGLPVTSIGSSAFYGCASLTFISIPEGVTSIGEQAFYGCTGLTSAIFLGDAPNHGGNSFANTAPDFTIYYLAGSTGFTSPTWNGYPTVMLDESTYPAAPWLVTHGLPYDTELKQDLNGNGVSLLMAYALDLDPKAHLQSMMPTSVVNGSSLSLSFHAAAPGITYLVETSTDLQNWTTDGVNWSVPGAGGHRTAAVERNGPRRFLRLRLVVAN